MKVNASLTTGLYALAILTPFANASSIEDFINSDERFYTTTQAAEGFGINPSFTLEKVSESDWKFSSVSPTNAWTKQGKLIIDGESAFIEFPSEQQFTMETFPVLNWNSDEFRNKWGDLVADQLIAANDQGLIYNPQLRVNHLDTAVEIQAINDADKLYTIVTVSKAEQLVIDQHIIDNIEGGWQGSTAPTVNVSPLIYGDNDFRHYIEGFGTSSVNAKELFTGEWAIPIYTDLEVAFGSDYPGIAYDIVNFDDTKTPSVEFAISADVNVTDNLVQLMYEDKILTYQPISETSQQILTLITVESETNSFTFMSNLVKKTDTYERFARGIHTHFPFAQIAYTNGRYAGQYYDEGQLECFSLWGHIFNIDDFSMHRGVGCNDGPGDGRDFDSIILPNPDTWEWEMNNARLTMRYVGDNYETFRERYWDPITFTQDGYGIVLERSLRDDDGSGEAGYFIRPRLNYIKLTDLSKYTQEYANGGFGGDADGDGIEDGPDTDDDNDGMPDYYEESFSLNHLNSADRNEDLDGDGLTNFEEFTLGSYPNDSDSDNDGIPDGEDTSPVPVDKEARTPYDYDGDGISDIVIRRPEIGQFIVARSSDGAIMRAFFGSQGSDIPLAGDFDGDGTTDLAIRRPSVKQFIARTSSDDSINRIFFGSQDEDIPVIADYDGDGIDDIAIRRPSSGQWFINYTTTGDIMRETFGTNASDIPAVADYDGDGKADIAVRRQDAGQFIIKYSSTGEIDRILFGSQSTDIPVPADYDGDGKADIAIRRPDSGFWFIKRSSDGVIERTFFGSLSDDIPVVADYDGDGKADIAIRRPSSGSWVAKLSADDSYARFYFGSKTTDIPLAAPLNTVLGMSNNTSASNATESLAGFEIDTLNLLLKESIQPDSSWKTEVVIED